MLNSKQATNHGITSESGDSEHQELSQLWRELLNGRARIVTAGTSADAHYFEVTPQEARRQSDSRRAARCAYLTRVLLGESLKVLQLDTGLSASTIATCLGDALQTLGLPRRGHQTPLLLVVLAHVAHGRVPCHHVQLMRRALSSGEGWVLWCNRPELELGDLLSAGERDVVIHLTAGRTYAEIARHRRTSPRTIANQIATAYRKLGLSGRSDLLKHLAGLVRSDSAQRPASASYAPLLATAV